MIVRLLLPVRFFLFTGLLTLLWSACSTSDDTIERIARFNAKKGLLSEYCKQHPESLSIFLAELYKEEKIDSGIINKTVAFLDKNPDKWILYQKRVVANLDSLNPTKQNPK